MTSLRTRLYLILTTLLIFIYVFENRRSKSEVRFGLRQELDDFYEMFRDEIRAEIAGNVYGGLGNKLQLDGKAYTNLLMALNAYDLLKGAEFPNNSPGSEVELVKIQLAAAEKAFRTVLQDVQWPHYRVNLSRDSINWSGPRRLNLFQKVKQPILFSLYNPLPEFRRLTLTTEGLVVPLTELPIGPASTRHFLGTVEAEKTQDSRIELRIKSKDLSQRLALVVRTQETGVLEGLLAEDGVVGPPIARVRVTDSQGRYYPPDTDKSHGLIRDAYGWAPGKKAERWFYAAGSFRVRAPLGKLKVAIRRGLEYRNLDQEVEIKPGHTVKKEFKLTRWIDMEKSGWYSGDIHIHYLDPPSVLFEMKAEDLHVANVLVFKHHRSVTARQHFTGAVDRISDQRYFVYYNEEFRHGVLGHVGLLNLKKLVEPISTGSLGTDRRIFWRIDYFNRPGQVISRYGDASSPDRLLVEAMRETHKQGGIVNWAHLRNELEFPLDAALGQLDAVDILTNTNLSNALTSWYHMLNCGLRLSATAGTDREGPYYPIGHQRVYTRLHEPFTYESWMEGIRKGSSFVTNAPVLMLTVNGVGPGEELKFLRPERLFIRARAVSQLPIGRLEIVINGDVVHVSRPNEEGLSAEILVEQPVSKSAWIAARCSGGRHPELFYAHPNPTFAHPVFAHTSPIYLTYPDEEIGKAESAYYLLDYLQRLEKWVTEEAYFENDLQKEETISTIQRGAKFYQEILVR